MILQRWSPRQVWQALFSSGSALVTLKHVVGRLRFFRSKGVDKIATYLYSSPSRGGRPETMDAGARGVLRAIIAENSGFTDVQIAEKLSELMIGPSPKLFASPETVRRVRIQEALVLKCYTRVPGQASPHDQELHYRIMASIHPDKILNIDETHWGKTKYKLKKGKGPRGKRLNIKEFIISGKTFMITACYSTVGFRWYHVCAGAVTHVEVEQILESHLRPTINDGDVVMWDNAPVHTVISTVNLLDEITEGLRKNVPAYSHRLSPVERGFANIWNDIRRNPIAATQPLQAVAQAFAKYSIGGEYAHRARKHFSVYAARHKAYCEADA